MATSAKKSIATTVAKKSYGKGTGSGPTPTAKGAGMDKSAKSDHAEMTKPAAQKGRY
jgi:hypothetical protein